VKIGSDTLFDIFETLMFEETRHTVFFDAELLRPAFLPRLAEVALSSLRIWRWGKARRPVEG
jgi:hypothetical protein